MKDLLYLLHEARCFPTSRDDETLSLNKDDISQIENKHGQAFMLSNYLQNQKKVL